MQNRYANISKYPLHRIIYLEFNISLRVSSPAVALAVIYRNSSIVTSNIQCLEFDNILTHAMQKFESTYAIKI